MLQSVTECYRFLQDVKECYRLLQSFTECYRVLQSVTERYRVTILGVDSSKKGAKMRQKKAQMKIVKYGQNLKGRWVN